MKLLMLTCVVATLLLSVGPVRAEEKVNAVVEQTTELPVADMALVDTAMDDSAMKTEKKVVKKYPIDAPSHTVADFIIHPFIALKPRVPEAENGKQADTGSTGPSSWQLFGFNAGQSLGSSVSSLADSVTGWLGNRIPLSDLIDTPVRELSTTTSTTTTSTPRPNVIIRIEQGSTRKPQISIDNDNRPINGNNVYDSEEEDDSEKYEDYDEDFNTKRKRYQDNNDDNDDDGEEGSNEHNEEDDEDYDGEDEEEEERPVKQTFNHRRRPKPLNHSNNNKRRNNNNTNQRRHFKNNKQQQKQEESAEVDQYDDGDNEDQDFYYNKNQPSKRFQNEQNFIKRDQQSLLNQIKYFTRGQTPAEVGNFLRKSERSTNKKRHQQATLLINRNGQTIYVAPELLQVASPSNNKLSATQSKRPPSYYPQPPLTVPYRKKGQPTQYITIPWSQLGISPPDQIVSLTEGIQSQPLILNIPQNVIDNMQDLKSNKKKQFITPDAVPLLAEASIMDIFKQPRIPPARTTTTSSGAPIVIATKSKPGPKRIRPDSLVEKAPTDDNMEDEKKNSAETVNDNDESESTQYIVIADESGDTKLSRSAYKQILDYFNHHRIGRQLMADKVSAMETSQTGEQLIPVQVITAEEESAKAAASIDDKIGIITKSAMKDTPREEIVENGKVNNAELIMESTTST